jgi:hypothetical protein
MPVVFACTCGKPLRAKEESAGKKTKCPQCGAIITIPGGSARVATPAAPPGPDDPQGIELAWPTVEAVPSTATIPAVAATDQPSSASIKIDSVSPAAGGVGGDPARPSDRPRPDDGTLQYKVLSGKDQGMTGKFNPLKLEEVLNDHARQGWSVKTASTVAIASHSGTHDELIIILER